MIKEENIKIERAPRWRACNLCHASNELNNIVNLTFRYDSTNSGTQIALCESCLKNLTNKIKEFNHGSITE